MQAQGVDDKRQGRARIRLHLSPLDQRKGLRANLRDICQDRAGLTVWEQAAGLGIATVGEDFGRDRQARGARQIEPATVARPT